MFEKNQAGESLLFDFCGWFTSGARAAILQVKAERAFAAEGASGVDAGGVSRAGLLLTLIHIYQNKVLMNKTWKKEELILLDFPEWLPWLQVRPFHPCWQRQVNWCLCELLHIPPFMQGFNTQGSPAVQRGSRKWSHLTFDLFQCLSFKIKTHNFTFLRLWI